MMLPEPVSIPLGGLRFSVVVEKTKTKIKTNLGCIICDITALVEFRHRTNKTNQACCTVPPSGGEATVSGMFDNLLEMPAVLQCS